MTVRTEVDDLQITRTEKLLAVVLAAFLLLGGVWTYTRVDDLVRTHVRVPTERVDSGPGGAPREQPPSSASSKTQSRSRTALQNLELRRKAYRRLEANKPAGRLERLYHGGAAVVRGRAARARYRAPWPPLPRLRRRPPQRSAERKIDAALQRQARDAFLLRLALVLAAIGLSYWLLARLHRRRTRWYPFAGSAVAFATIFAFVFAADYLTDYFDPFEWGIAFVALVGIAATLLAYLALQRYLLKRLPQRRARGLMRDGVFAGMAQTKQVVQVRAQGIAVPT